MEFVGNSRNQWARRGGGDLSTMTMMRANWISAAVRGFLRLWNHASAPPARLAVIERVSLAPRQSLALVEADGIRLLVATSPDASITFFPLSQQRSSSDSDEPLQARAEAPDVSSMRAVGPGVRQATHGSLKLGRVSW